MNTSRIKKIIVLLVIIGLIFIQILNPKVNAEGIDINNIFGNEITDDEGNGSDLNNAVNNTSLDNIVNEAANNTSNNATNNVVNNTTKNTTNNTSNNSTLPKTGTSENVLLLLMGICAISGIYAYKKVKEYNM